MNLQERINLLHRLGEYIQSDNYDWQKAKEKASRENNWFSPEFVELAVSNIASSFLSKEKLAHWAGHYDIGDINQRPKKIGIVMAGNIPLVGFHDFLCVFICGHKSYIKSSHKDQVLIKHLADTLALWNDEIRELIIFSEMLKGCDAYIATGSNNSSGYFEYYFNKYPHIIRRNKTSVAILDGLESTDELSMLADDVYGFFGLGCRNVTKLYIPADYDFIPLLNAFKKYNYLADNHRYKNNYDYNLAILLLNKKFFMSNESILLVEETSLFSPISQLNYEFYSDKHILLPALYPNKDLQCIAGKDFIPFGGTQCPSLSDYADGIDTMRFLTAL
ncbi:MAG: acyl-CoA reductase [Chitinophagaceae bacterium]